MSCGSQVRWRFSIGRWGERPEDPRQVEAQFIIAAVKLVRDYFWPHARAALRQIGLSERHATSRRILRWIKAKDLYEISIKDIRRDALGSAPDAEQTLTMLAELERTGWLRETTIKTGGRDKRRWAVNSKLFPGRTAETAETAETAA